MGRSRVVFTVCQSMALCCALRLCAHRWLLSRRSMGEAFADGLAWNGPLRVGRQLPRCCWLAVTGCNRHHFLSTTKGLTGQAGCATDKRLPSLFR